MSIEIANNKIQDEPILIREAKPDLDEGLLFAQFLNEASEGFFKAILGNETFEIISEAYVKSNNDFSFENAFFIEYNGEIVGMVSGYTKSEKVGFKRKILSKSTKGSKFRIRMFSVIGRILSHFLGPRGKDEFYIQAIAISSPMRGKGLGQKLLEHIADKSIERGSKTLSLDVSSKNTKAINSYTIFGMKVSSYWPNFLKLPPVFTRMEKQL